MASHLTAHRADQGRRPHLARLRTIVRSRMWQWLFDAQRVLGLTVEILDDQFEVLLSSRDGKALRDRYQHVGGEPLEHVFRGSVGHSASAVARADDVRFGCALIVGGGVVAGGVLIGADRDAPIDDADLMRLAQLLAETLADQLSRSSGDHRAKLHQISALYQLLHAAIATGSEREVLRTFAEALSIWEETEVLAYRADLSGRFGLEMALPGSDLSRGPRTLAIDPSAAGVRRLTPVEREALGFSAPGDTVIAMLTSEGGQWAIAMSSAPETGDGERCEVYVAALGHALNGCVAVETSRLAWAVMQQFVDRDPPGEAARRALGELTRPLSATGAFVVLDRDGEPVLAVGDERRIEDGHRPIANARILRSPIAAPAPFSAAVELEAAKDHSFTPRDAKLFEAAIASFTAWLPAALRRVAAGERRGNVKSFDQIVDRYARELPAANDDASLILISAGDRSLPIDTTHAWIKRLRPQLRPTDLAGRLTSGELGILLLQTPQAGAQVVARRLLRIFATTSDDDPAVTIGVASQNGDATSAESLISRARRQPVDQPIAS